MIRRESTFSAEYFFWLAAEVALSLLIISLLLASVPKIRVLTGLGYAIWLTAIAAVIMGLYEMLILPSFANMFQEFDTNLPDLTQFALSWSESAFRPFLVALIFLVLLLLFWISIAVIRPESKTLPRWLIRIPEKRYLIGNYVAGMEVRDGAIHVEFGHKVNSHINGKFISFRPQFIKQSPMSPISWLCGNDTPVPGMTAAGDNNTDLLDTYLPAACR